MRMALITADGLVENVVEAEPGFIPGEGLVLQAAPAAVGPGWRWQNETFLAPDPAPGLVPDSVSDLQFRLALNVSGLREDVERFLASAAQEIRDYWDRALVIRRDSDLVAGAAQAFGKTAADIDDLFRLAVTL